MKSKILLSVVGLVLGISTNVYADVFDGIHLNDETKQEWLKEIGVLTGIMEISGEIFIYEQGTNNLYSFNGVDYVYIPYGDEDILTRILHASTPENLQFTLSLDEARIGLYTTYKFNSNKGIYVPLNSLKGLYTVDGNIINNTNSISSSLSITPEYIVNLTDSSLSLTYSDADSNIWEIQNFIQDAPYYLTNIEILELSKSGEILYSTMDEDYAAEQARIFELNEQYIHEKVVAKQEQIEAAEAALKAQQAAIEASLTDVFPASIITGTMKYATNGFSAGQSVIVDRASSGNSYYIRASNGSLVTVPWNSVSIPSDPATYQQRATTEQIEDYINAKGMTSRTNYLVWTDLYRQRTYVFQKVDDRWTLIRDILCSTGKNITPTPRGTYQLQSYVPYFGVSKGYMCKNAVQFMGDYLFHSILFDQTGSYLLEGRGILGVRASQGCVRFSPEESEWFYGTLPLGTTVWIN